MTGSDLSTSALIGLLDAFRGKAQRIAITAHVRPDGDAVGASIGLYHILRARQIQADLVGLDDIPARYQFLCHDTTVLVPGDADPAQYGLLVILDTGALDRAPDFVATWQQQVPTLNIDHHPTNTRFGTSNHVQADAAAVAEIITRLADTAGWTIPPPAAAALWVGIVTDAGRFAYSCTTPATLTAAAHLLSVGLDTPTIDQQVFQSLPLAALRLQARAIDNMTLLQQDRLAIITLAQQDFRDCQAKPEDAEEIINLPRRLDTVDVSILLTEKTDSTPEAPRTKASFRTRPPFDAGALCQTFGGGGHARAAGCELPCALADAHTTIRTAVQKTWFCP